MMEVDSWRGEGGFQGGEGVRGGGAELWISRHQTDHISPAPHTFGDGLKNPQNQQHLSPELEQRRENPETRKAPEKEPGGELGKEVTDILEGVTVGDTDDKPGRISGYTLDRFGQKNIKEGLAECSSHFLCLCFETRVFLQKMLLLEPGYNWTYIQLKISILDFVAMVFQRCHGLYGWIFTTAWGSID